MISYLKIDGNGNNFLVLDNREKLYDDEALSLMAQRDCNIKTSVGADGLLVVEKSEIADFKMRIVNSNGFEGEMCGNGARCIALYAYREGIASSRMTFETLAGLIRAVVAPRGILIQIGEFQVEALRAKNRVSLRIDEALVVDISYYFITVGVPHAIIDLSENNPMSMETMRLVGKHFNENRALFPVGTNVNFLSRSEEGSLEVVTYERGVDDFTDSCGTGSCACALLEAVRSQVRTPVKVKNPGGINLVHYQFSEDRNSCELSLEGMAHCRADIIIRDEYI